MSDSQDVMETADPGPGLGLDVPAQPTPPESAQPYRVLARKYRPQSFDALIGQDAMVQTLANAIKRDRLAHAFLLTGVRGVGKTTTARLIAKALNCIGADGEGGPTIDPCGTCEPCVAIAEGRDMDVIEMDAASNRGIDDVREVINIVRAGPNMERYLVYIVDEVHMLTKEAFNALLKTLEEPPSRIKFIFATTEINKVPVTVLSRCQRFDLRRIPANRLAAHFRWIVDQEDVEAEDEALALIARASEGSVRDGLSILDQAIAHGAGSVTAGQVRDMLGLSDRGAVRSLFGQLLAADAQAVLATVQEQYDLGTDPAALFRGLLETTHGIVRAKVGGADDPALSAEERAAFADWASRLGFAAIHRIWQLLLKGLHEVETAPVPIEAAEMALLRIVHAAGLPDPGELARKFESGEFSAAATPAQTPTGSGGGAQDAFPPTFAGLVKLVAESRHDDESWRTAQILEREIRLVRYEPPNLVLRPTKPRDEEFFRDLGRLLREETGHAWMIETSDETGEPSLLEQEQAALNAEREAILQSPLVKAAFEAFPEAELIDYKLAPGGTG